MSLEIPNPDNPDNRTILYGVEQPGVYDGVLYWVDTNGYAFHRFTENYMKLRAQPFIDAHNAGRTFTEERGIQ